METALIPKRLVTYVCVCVKGKGLLYYELKSIKLSRVDCFDDRKIIVNHISHLLFLRTKNQEKMRKVGK